MWRSDRYRDAAPVRADICGSYRTLEQAVEAFHLKPPEPILNHDLLRRVAAGAYRQSDDGWSLVRRLVASG
jgi:hypothetical protein